VVAWSLVGLAMAELGDGELWRPRSMARVGEHGGVEGE
jgi:hypothetical protein